MKVIEMNVDVVGYGIHVLAEKTAREAKEPVKVKMIFHGDNNFQYRYSDAVATDGTPDEAIEFFAWLLDTHDRYYDYSDDARVWRAGEAQWARIQRTMKVLTERGIQFQEIYSEWLGDK